MHPPPDSARQKGTPSASDAGNGWKESTAETSGFVILTAGAAAMGCLLALLPAAGHDQTWCLYAADLVRHGVPLYGPELFESNPPLIVWLSVVPCTLGAWLHLAPTAVGKLLVTILGAGIAAACLRLLRQYAAWTRPGMAALGFVYVAAFMVIPARDFGQRDQMLPFLCLPYLICAALAMERRRVAGGRALLAGVAAGIGIGLKPHHLILVLIVEAAVALRLRGIKAVLRPEVLALAGTTAMYGAAIRWITPRYLTDVVPVLRDTYWAIGHFSFAGCIREAIQLHVLAITAIALYLFRRGNKVRPLVQVLLLAGIGSTFAYYLQGTGWYYQQLPAITFFTFALAVEGVDWMRDRRLPAERNTWVAAALLSVVAVGLTAYFSGYRPARPFEFPSGLSESPDPTFFVGLAPATPVAILTTAVDESLPPVVTHHLVWAQRQNNLWTLPAILRNEEPRSPGDPARRIPADRLAALDTMQHTWMVEDLERWRPKIILVERCQDAAVRCQVLEDRHDDLLAWFLRDARFREAFRGYRYVRSAGRFDEYVPR